MAGSMFPDSLFVKVKEALQKEYKPGTTITSPTSCERKALNATTEVLAEVARFYEEMVADGQD